MSLNMPQKLYDMCINVAVADCISVCKFCKKEFRHLPINVLFDFYYQMFLSKRLCLLSVEFSDIDIMDRLLYIQHKRVYLLKCFQALIDHGTNVTDELLKRYLEKVNNHNKNDIIKLIDTGLKMGYFLNEGGWFSQSIQFLNVTETLCRSPLSNENSDTKILFLEKLLKCYELRIAPESVNCDFDAAMESCEGARRTVSELEGLNVTPMVAGLFTNYSLMYFVRSQYDKAFYWSQQALLSLNDKVPLRVVIEVLRQASKSCVVKRRFSQAGLLIRQAVNLAHILYEKDHLPHFSDTLLDYGFYLLNYDSIKESVVIYEKALEIRKQVFEKYNVHVAIGHEDLAYALYVNEYSSGNFDKARENAERSIRILEKVLPKDHLMLASVKRVKALILEEIALDERNDPQRQSEYYEVAEKLHKTALELSHKAFGEKNVQTAKHYGNLGRLYQSMKQYEQAEEMHLKAIAIKEELLGENDYEVGLSVGHLASLYNYHMKRYLDAEKLYLRSIQINLNLFGEAYSGLEYDYRGLVNVYVKLCDAEKVVFYNDKMTEWNRLREEIVPVKHKEELLPVAEIVERFLSMCD